MMVTVVFDPEVAVSKTPAWGAVYAMSPCVFALIASEFMPITLFNPIAHNLHLTAGP